jgi:hypothetical protein
VIAIAFGVDGVGSRVPEHVRVGWNAFVMSLCHGCKVAIGFGVRPAELFTHRRDCGHAFTISNYVEARL